MQSRNIAGPDSLRFVAALFVLFSHSPAFRFRFLFGPSGLAAQLSSAYELMFNGVAAVLVFFAISGVYIRQRMILYTSLSKAVAFVWPYMHPAFETEVSR